MREYLDAAVFKDMILCADAALAENTQQINELNVFPVPDGDTGTNMGLTMNEAAAQLRKKEFYAVDAVADCVAGALLRGAPALSCRFCSEESRADSRAWRPSAQRNLPPLWKTALTQPIRPS